MAQVIATIRIMPDGPEADAEALEAAINTKMEKHKATVHKVEKKPVAFGIVSINVTITRDEDLGTFDDLEGELSQLDHVSSVETIDVRRAVG